MLSWPGALERGLEATDDAKAAADDAKALGHGSPRPLPDERTRHRIVFRDMRVAARLMSLRATLRRTSCCTVRMS